MLLAAAPACPIARRSAVIRFPDCFVLIFGELAVGGFLCLSVLPFQEIERGFYKSSAAVFLTAALAMIGAKLALLVRAAPPWSSVSVIETGAWMLFTTAATVYLYSLWGDPYRLRALAYLATLGTGLVALAISASRFSAPGLGPVALLLYPASFAASAAVLGTSVTGMLLGHWYLIDTGMSLRPLERVLRAFVVALICQLALLALVLALFVVTASPEATLAQLWSAHGPALAARLVLGPVAALGIAALITRTLAIPQTMAATGLFYIAVLAVAVGEMLSRLLLLRTALPL
jgi:hypothetical protein